MRRALIWTLGLLGIGVTASVVFLNLLFSGAFSSHDAQTARTAVDGCCIVQVTVTPAHVFLAEYKRVATVASGEGNSYTTELSLDSGGYSRVRVGISGPSEVWLDDGFVAWIVSSRTASRVDKPFSSSVRSIGYFDFDSGGTWRFFADSAVKS